jgi:hypothetical protein
MTINDPEVVAELSALYPRYEEALVDNDVDTLMAVFWAGPQVMRFGAAENLYGPVELEAYRKARPAASLARTVTRLPAKLFVGGRARCGYGCPRDGALCRRMCRCCREPEGLSVAGGAGLCGEGDGQLLNSRRMECVLKGL